MMTCKKIDTTIVFGYEDDHSHDMKTVVVVAIVVLVAMMNPVMVVVGVGVVHDDDNSLE